MQRGDKVYRKTKAIRPILGTITETWIDRTNRQHAHVLWERTMAPGHRLSGNDAMRSSILCSSLVLATDELIAARNAEGKTAVDSSIAARNAKRAGVVYPISYGVFNVTDGTPRTTRLFSAVDPGCLRAELAKYERHYPHLRFAILGYEDGWDETGETGERRTRRWIDEVAA